MICEQITHDAALAFFAFHLKMDNVTCCFSEKILSVFTLDLQYAQTIMLERNAYNTIVVFEVECKHR